MEINPSDYLPAEQANGASQEELQQHHFDEVAQNLNNRRQNEYYSTQITDEDIDAGLGSIHPALAENEYNLQKAIANASKATSPAERARWQTLAESYAARSVVSKERTVDNYELTDDDKATTFERLTAQGHDVKGTLAWAGEESWLSDDTIDEFNAVLNGKNGKEARDAYGILDQARKHPERFVEVSEMQEFSQIDIQEFAERFGDETAKQIELTTLALMNGVVTPLKAIQNIRKYPEIARNIDILVQEGRLVLPL